MATNNPTFPVLRFPILEQVPLPPVQRVRLSHPQADPVADLQASVVSALEQSARFRQLPAGSQVAVAVGSRGIARIDEVVTYAISWLKERGLEPFIVPAMGSHGGAKAEGQAAVLAQLGVTEERVGAPVRATMEVVEYGATKEGIPCYFDANAAAADAVLLLARVKSHTSFDRTIESGLNKMVAVGLGKDRGARSVHTLGPRGYTEILPQLSALAIEHSPIAYGIALVENARKDLVTVEGVEPENFMAADERLLKQAKKLLARLPFEQIDALIVEWIGKEISGAGMDYAVTARTDIRGKSNPPTPFIHKIGLLGITAKSDGNGIGLGVADFTTRQAAESCDLQKTYTNAIISTFGEKARIPIVLPDDRTVINACVLTCWRADPENARLCIIHSTLYLNEILVSPSLLADLEGHADIEILSEPEPLAFDENGALLTRCGI